MRARWLVLVLVASTASADPSPAYKIMDPADAAPDDPAVQTKALREIDAAIKISAKDPTLYVARGILLDRLKRPGEAVVADRTAYGLDPTLAIAHYQAGLALSEEHQLADAATEYEAALRIDPKDVDSAYNLGQSRYSLGQFAAALAAWQTAQALTPDDFEIAKKILQCEVALGRTADAAKARDHVLALWKASADPQVKNLRDFVFDQFDTEGWHIYAAESFDPSFYIYRFNLADPANHIAGSVNVETDTFMKSQGQAAILAIERADGTRVALGMGFKTMPPYPELKRVILKVIHDGFGPRP